MSRVYNKSRCEIEPAKIEICPRCKGFGAVAFHDNDGCTLCNRGGYVWEAKSGSGWTRAKYARLENSKLW